MDTLIESIRTAVADNASDDAKQAGALACRAILTALEATPGQALAAPSATPPNATSPIAATVAALRTVPPDQLLDLVIAKLRAALPDSPALPTRTSALRIPLVPVPRTEKVP